MNKETMKNLRKGLCAPSVIGAILGLSAIITSAVHKDSRTHIGEVVLTAVVQFLILYTLCYYGHNKVAWAFLLLPLILLVPVILLAFGVAIGGGMKK